MKFAELDAGNSVTETVCRCGNSRVRRTSKCEVFLPTDKSRWVSEDDPPNNIGTKRSQLRATVHQRIYSLVWGKIHLKKVSIYKRLFRVEGRRRSRPCQSWKETSCEVNGLMEFPRMKAA